ncbi:DUF3168 domain-containing protein [Streptomyces fradiae]|uniref:DUF3168 domain-containing protein n=1 Tax=Streptomyces fradiae TaxID=1906 RepID=UPI002942406A|nr:DUF3168 domain-containing protein [Streptomyces fradiae]WOI58604.1 DUF3168 domain-containing protein [Streptomyces fradiae]
MSAPSPMLPVQRAVYGRLTGDATLMGLVSGVYDYVPEDVTWPYVVIGEALEVPENWLGGFGRQTTITVHVWTRARGHSPGLGIAARITELLDHQPLTLDGLHHVATRYEFSQTLTDPEPPGDIRHVVLRYRVTTQQPPP